MKRANWETERDRKRQKGRKGQKSFNTKIYAVIYSVIFVFMSISYKS